MILHQKILFFPIAEGGTKICGVFRVNNHDFTPKNPIFSNFRGGHAPGSPPSGSAPAVYPQVNKVYHVNLCLLYCRVLLLFFHFVTVF